MDIVGITEPGKSKVLAAIAGLLEADEELLWCGAAQADTSGKTQLKHLDKCLLVIAGLFFVLFIGYKTPWGRYSTGPFFDYLYAAPVLLTVIALIILFYNSWLFSSLSRTFLVVTNRRVSMLECQSKNEADLDSAEEVETKVLTSLEYTDLASALCSAPTEGTRRILLRRKGYITNRNKMFGAPDQDYVIDCPAVASGDEAFQIIKEYLPKGTYITEKE